MERDKRAGRAFFGLTALLMLALALKWLWFDPEVLAGQREFFLIDFKLVLCSRMARVTVLLCTFLLPPLAVKAKLHAPRWVIWLFLATGIGFDLWYLFIYATSAGLIPETGFYAKAWEYIIYWGEKDMLYLVLPQLPIVLAFAMGGRRDRMETEGAQVSEEISTPDELTAPLPKE
ncbi:MAG TPA: hypothetical protein VN369_08545 [Terriglobales bacterium]|nr:hypothetical protein [Terriglobales bacterium]